MVKLLWVADDRRCLTLTGGYLKQDPIKAGAPRNPKTFRPSPSLNFKSKEEATAWALSTMIRRKALKGRFKYSQDIDIWKLPIYTWLIGTKPNTLGRLDHLFDEAKDHGKNNYRLILHKEPLLRTKNGHLETYGGGIYSYNPRKPILLEASHFSIKQKELAYTFLWEALDACKDGNKALEEIIRSIGHQLWGSSGIKLDAMQ
jgi:hypothetical protein